jgi:hypothetical protein
MAAKLTLFSVSVLEDKPVTVGISALCVVAGLAVSFFWCQVQTDFQQAALLRFKKYMVWSQYL